MLCEDCLKNEATLHFTKIINGQKKEMHLCDECAREKGDHIPGSTGYSIHELLSGLLHGDPFDQKSPHTANRAREKPLVCPECGLSYQHFINKGRFGCAHCYETFSLKLDPIFRRVHGGNVRHHGKVPKRAGGKMQLKRQIQHLRNQMEIHVEREEFEEAAKIRDQIREIEKKISQKEGGE